MNASAMRPTHAYSSISPISAFIVERVFARVIGAAISAILVYLCLRIEMVFV